MSIKQDILTYSRQAKIAPLSPLFDSLLDQLVTDNVYPTPEDLKFAGNLVVNDIKIYGNKHNIDTVVIGMSGGVDSALTAALFKAAGWRVIGVTMPIHQKPVETARGVEACATLGIEHQHVDLTQTYEDLLESVRNYDKDIDDADHAHRRGNLRVRLRMLTVYNIASSVRGLVGSTDNFSELAAGFWTLHGDVGDLAPIQGFNKSWEVPKLAELYGVPGDTVFATPTDGLGFSESDESQFGFSYLEFDIVLHHCIRLLSQRTDLSMQEVLNFLVPETDNQLDLLKIIKITTRIKNSAFKRENPYNISHPMQPDRFAGLTILDGVLHE